MSTPADFTFPLPDTPPLRAGRTLKWGVAGPGRIASAFVRALQTHTDQRIVAVGSRSSQRASTFAAAHSIPRAWPSYEALVNDPDVEIVYIATPNHAHAPLALLALDAGKHILVEKPMASDAGEVARVSGAARQSGLFAMEGMWSAFLPRTRVVRQLLDSGELGDVRLVSADFGEYFDPDLEVGVFDAHMAGGALRDIGIYPAWFAQFVLGVPDRLTARGVMTAAGVDAQVAMVLDWSSGAQALLSTSVLAQTPNVASIAGTRARVDFASPFVMPGDFTLTSDSSVRTWTDDSGVRGLDGLAWEAAAVADCIHRGMTEAPWHPLDATRDVIGMLDRARAELTEFTHQAAAPS